MTPLSFLVFADLHYKQDMYASTVNDLRTVLDRAAAEQVDLVLHAGDFCNDYPGSPEVVDLYWKNPHGLPVYGCYGNHELETAGTSMPFVTPRLTNRNVVWGTADGSMGDGSIGHYYFDRNGFRFVVTDTNYSLRPDGVWERNLTGSHCPARENTLWNSLGPAQLLWLEQTLTDAAQRVLHCIVVSHITFNTWRTASPDAARVREIFAQANALRPHTVVMAINGHHHTDGLKQEDGILYFDVNAVRNAWWHSVPHGLYGEEGPTFPFIAYDENGQPTEGPIMRPLLSLRQGNRTLFTVDPLSAVVRIDANGEVTVTGTDSAWVADLAPDTDKPFVRPAIGGGKFRLI